MLLLFQMHAFQSLLFLIAVLLVMSFGFGLMVGGPDRGKAFVAWELRKLLKLTLWLLGLLLDALMAAIKLLRELIPS